MNKKNPRGSPMTKEPFRIFSFMWMDVCIDQESHGTLL